MMNDLLISELSDDNDRDNNNNNSSSSNYNKSKTIEISVQSSSKPLFSFMSDNESGFFNETSRLQMLEQEQEQLTASLMSLTTHFAQVQFRLKQIVTAPIEEKEVLLKDLEEFAFRGCPNLNKPNSIFSESFTSNEQIIQEQNAKQKNLIEQLKQQLQDLESYAYESGNVDDMPSTLVLEKQKVIIDELKERINLPIDNLNKLSNEELKKVVDSAICQIVTPVKIKEQLVNQLKTQISDLERFILFLQGEVSSPGPYGQYNKSCKCSSNESAFPVFNQPTKSKHEGEPNETKNIRDDPNNSSIDLLKRMLSIMQIFAITQLGCGIRTFEKNSLKKTSTNHWGDMRANLEIAISKVLKLYGSVLTSLKQKQLKFNSSNTTTGESDDELTIDQAPNDLIRAVRKDLAGSLRDLMQHGLIEVNRGSSMVPFGCFVVRSKEVQNQLHIWELLMKYFEIGRAHV